MRSGSRQGDAAGEEGDVCFHTQEAINLTAPERLEEETEGENELQRKKDVV